MLCTKNGFEKSLLEKFKKEFNYVEITKEEMLIIKEESFEVSIEFDKIYTEYTLINDVDKCISQYIHFIKKAINNSTEINLDRVYPILKQKNFGKNEQVHFLRDHFVLDLDILYASDLGDSFKFVLENEKINIKELKEKAFNNLNKITNVLAKLDNSIDIYSFKFNSDHCATLFLNENVKMQIRKKVGNNFLFAIPSPSTLLIAKNIIGYVDILQRLILEDPDPNKVSIRVYQCKNGEFLYADI